MGRWPNARNKRYLLRAETVLDFVRFPEDGIDWWELYSRLHIREALRLANHPSACRIHVFLASEAPVGIVLCKYPTQKPVRMPTKIRGVGECGEVVIVKGRLTLVLRGICYVHGICWMTGNDPSKYFFSYILSHLLALLNVAIYGPS